jgi:hypothetical protein
VRGEVVLEPIFFDAKSYIHDSRDRSHEYGEGPNIEHRIDGDGIVVHEEFEDKALCEK